MIGGIMTLLLVFSNLYIAIRAKEKNKNGLTINGRFFRTTNNLIILHFGTIIYDDLAGRITIEFARGLMNKEMIVIESNDHYTIIDKVTQVDIIK